MTTHAIILVAGIGSRLKPLTDKTHKALIQVGGKTILERQLDSLAKNGIADFHLVLGHRARDLRQFVDLNFGAATNLKFHFYVNELFDRNNTASSLHIVLNTMRNDFLLLDGDVLLSDNLMASLCAAPAMSRLLCETDPAKLDAEAVRVTLNTDGMIEAIGKNIPLDKAHGESIGVGFYTKDWAEALHAFLNTSLKDEKNWHWYYEDAIQCLIDAGQAPSPLLILPTGTEPWVEVDNHADLARAQRLFASL